MICVLLSLCWHTEIGLRGVREYIPGPADFISFLFRSEERVIENYKLLKGLSRGQAIVQWVSEKQSFVSGGGPAGETWFMIGCLNPLMLCTERTLKSCQTSIWGKHEIDRCVCFRYLTLVESVPTYGVHYYEVKVKTVNSEISDHFASTFQKWKNPSGKACYCKCSLVLIVTRRWCGTFLKK